MTHNRGREHVDHRGQAVVEIGGYKISPGGAQHLRQEDIDRFGLIISLTGRLPRGLTQREGQKLITIDWLDMQPPPANLAQTIDKEIVPELAAGQNALGFCYVGHGRTGTFLSFLVGMTMPEVEDPIQHVRDIHCHEAVERLGQAEAIFAFLRRPLPERYQSMPR